MCLERKGREEGTVLKYSHCYFYDWNSISGGAKTTSLQKQQTEASDHHHHHHHHQSHGCLGREESKLGMGCGGGFFGTSFYTCIFMLNYVV